MSYHVTSKFANIKNVQNPATAQKEHIKKTKSKDKDE